MDKFKILVTGANGQLGSELRGLANAYPQFDFLFTDYNELSITDADAVQLFFEKNTPDYCINCAAYTAVDKAEDPAELQKVTAVNADAVANLAKACTACNAKLVHISTDYVFDGVATTPIKETDTTNPVSVYGATKLQGEKYAQQFTDPLIIRTAWVYSAYGKNFVKTMMHLMQTKPAISVVADQYGTPTYAHDLAKAIMDIIAGGNWQPGMYHYTNEGQICWYEFAIAIKNATGSNCEVSAIPASAYPTPAARPAYSVLDKTKIRETFGVEIPDWEDSLKICIDKLQAQPI